MEQLQQQIVVVATARKLTQEKANALKTARAVWEEANKTLLDEVVQTSQFTSAAETILRELTLKAYADTGNKTPVPGVGIREVTKLEYASQDAFKWAVEHNMALKLDVSAFEKIVKASPLDFVKITQEPQATIATDLSKYLTNNNHCSRI